MTDINAVIERLEAAAKESDSDKAGVCDTPLLLGAAALQGARADMAYFEGHADGIRLALSYLREEQ